MSGKIRGAEVVMFDLSTNEFVDIVHPQGYKNLISFEMGHGPVWRFQVGDAVIEKSITLVHGQDTVIVRYVLVSAGRRGAGEVAIAADAGGAGFSCDDSVAAAAVVDGLFADRRPRRDRVVRAGVSGAAVFVAQCRQVQRERVLVVQLYVPGGNVARLSGSRGFMDARDFGIHDEAGGGGGVCGVDQRGSVGEAGGVDCGEKARHEKLTRTFETVDGRRMRF